MRTHVRRTVCAGVMAGGFTVLGLALAAAPASADDTNGTGGLISGNQSGLKVHLPVTIGGQQVTVGGNGNTQSGGGGSAGSGGGSSSGSNGSGGSTSGSDATGSGNQTGLGAQLPVDVSGNQVSVLGDHNTSRTPAAQHAANPAATPFQGTSGQDGTGAGNQTALQVGTPVTACGNQVTVIGDGNDAAGCGTTPASGTAAPSSDGSSGDASTTGQDGTASGNQSWLGLVVPVDAGGNQVTVIGDGNGNSQSPSSGNGSSNGSSSATTPGTTTGQDGTGAGNQTGLEGSAPVDASGNQVTVIGDGNTSQGSGTSGTTGSPSGTTTGDGNTTDGSDGTGSGNQTDPSVTAPVTGTANQVTVIGDGNTSQDGGATTGGTATGGTGSTTDGSGGTGSGNQTDPTVAAPVTFGGNQVTVLGDGNTRTGATTTDPTTDPTTGGDETTDPTDPTSTDPTSTGGGTTGSGTGSGKGSGSTSNDGTSTHGSQAAAAIAQGSLPAQLADTGAPAGLRMWLLLGLMLVAAGLVLCTRRFTALGSAVLGRR